MLTYIAIAAFLAFLVLTIGSAFSAYTVFTDSYDKNDLGVIIGATFALALFTILFWPILIPIAIGAGIGFAFKKIKGD